MTIRLNLQVRFTLFQNFNSFLFIITRVLEKLLVFYRLNNRTDKTRKIYFINNLYNFLLKIHFLEKNLFSLIFFNFLFILTIINN